MRIKIDIWPLIQDLIIEKKSFVCYMCLFNEFCILLVILYTFNDLNCVYILLNILHIIL